MESLRQDLAYALRRLLRAPAFTLVATATLALGIGANTAIFSVINGVLLQPLPFPEPERLVRVSQVWKGKPTVMSPQNFLDLQAQSQSFESLSAYDNGGVILTGRGTPARVEGAQVSASFFGLLRVAPRLGRGFLAGENEPARSRVVVLGHELWSERFGADPSIVGQTIHLDRAPFEVVGVAPAGFTYPEGSQLWTPLEHDETFRTRSRGAWYLTVIGRLREGITVEQASQEAALIAARLAQQYKDVNEGVGGTAGSLHESIVGQTRPALLVLLGAVGFVLLIACVNVANLLLARVAARESELALRSALGASRARLLRQLITESVLLSVIGGAAGVMLASLSLDGLLALQPADMPRADEVRLDRTVLAFAAVLSVATGLLFGAFPALHMARRATAQSLREGARSLIGGRGGRLRAGLVVGQVALAMVLLAGAGLLIRSFTQLRHVEPGFDPRSALTFRIALPESAYPEETARAAFMAELLTRLETVPGVRQVGAVMGLPMSGTRFSLSFGVDGRAELAPAQQPTMEVRVTTPGYFGTMGIPVKRGRGFLPTDVATSAPVAVITETAAARYFPGQDPLGQRITLGWRRPDDKPKAGGVVVGIVGDVREHGLAADYPAEIYVPYAQLPVTAMDVVLRTSVEPESLLPAVQAAMRGLDPDIPAARPRTLEAIVARSLGEPRFYMTLLGAFAFTALALAALGIFGVMSYVVVQRSREIGIRIALGALPADILRATLREALMLALGGVLVGLFGALLLSRTLDSLLFGLSPHDPSTFAAVAALLTTIAMLASLWPARRASRVDPITALRTE
jgi:putative ABC transport system permease protein